MTRTILHIAALALGVTDGALATPGRVLRVCADPNNLPFSSTRGGGLEDELGALIAGELDATIAPTWWAQRRGFVRNTLGAHRCDVILGVPTGVERVAKTRPYYRSAYAFVSRADRALDVHSLDDPRLRTWKVGVPLVGDDGFNPPPVHALARRGIVDNVVGYGVYGDYAEDSPPAELIRAVARGDVDVAIAWGPLAGGIAAADGLPLVVTPVDEVEDAGVPMRFAIAIGVRKDDAALRDELDGILEARAGEVDALLERHGVPRVEAP